MQIIYKRTCAFNVWFCLGTQAIETVVYSGWSVRRSLRQEDLFISFNSFSL
jgi:hypothetical protein